MVFRAELTLFLIRAENNDWGLSTKRRANVAECLSSELIRVGAAGKNNYQGVSVRLRDFIFPKSGTPFFSNQFGSARRFWRLERFSLPSLFLKRCVSRTISYVRFRRTTALSE
jgi:hypothetical protein